MRGLALALVMLSTAPAVAAPGCQIGHYWFVFGQDAATAMTEKSGVPCTSRINVRAGVRSMTISQPPANGTAWSPEGHAWSYRSKPGYHGPDHFVVAIDGSQSSNNRGRVVDGVAHLAVDVNVQ